MIRNYIKIAIRNLKRNKIYSFISILGLAVGITGAALLYLYIDSELSYDAFHSESDRIYRIVEVADRPGSETRYFGQTTPALGSTLLDTYPEVEQMIRVYKPGGHVDMVHGGERIHERNYLIADPGFFDLFDFKVVRGDAATALQQPNSVVISESMARRLFGNDNPVGEVLTFTGSGDNRITGVIEDVPDNSHLQFDLLFSRLNSNFDWSEYLTSWENYGAYTYLLLRDSAEPASFGKKLDAFIENQQAVNENARNFYLQPITEIYFGSGAVEFGIEAAHGNRIYIYLFAAVGIFLLLIAGINYMNLATALSARRSKEIGIRKAAGAEKSQLVGQFLSESVVIALFACICSYFLIELMLPSFNQLTGKSFGIAGESVGYIAAVLLVIGLILGIASGSYPAFYLALVKPVRVLKANIDLKGGNLTLRKVLVVVQFSLSIILIIGTLAVHQQMEYIRSTDLGFERDRVLVVDINHGDVRSRFDAMKQELQKVPGVADVAVSSRVPGEWKNITQEFARPVGSGSTDTLQTAFMGFDEDMLSLYEIDLVEGSNFTGNQQVDSMTVLLNEAAVRALKLEDPVGSLLHISDEAEPLKVVGVVQNFNYRSLHQEVGPLIIGYRANPFRVIDYFSLKLAGGEIPATIERIKGVHRQFDPETAMEYHFLDSQIEQKYRADVRAGRLFAIGGGVTIFIACMGLFGLALFTTETRLPEVGIRKVLGASVSQILLLLTSDFMKLVAAAFLVAIPVGWFVMHNWLQNFAYHTEIGPGIFALAGIGALAVSLLTISWQSVRAALTDPVKSLRNE